LTIIFSPLFVDWAKTVSGREINNNAKKHNNLKDFLRTRERGEVTVDQIKINFNKIILSCPLLFVPCHLSVVRCS
jgi:hypothetical protein